MEGLFLPAFLHEVRLPFDSTFMSLITAFGFSTRGKQGPFPFKSGLKRVLRGTLFRGTQVPSALSVAYESEV